MAKKTECPGCFFEWEIKDADIMVGEVVTCPDCGVDLEVTSIDGPTIKLEKLDAADEDWGE